MDSITINIDGIIYEIQYEVSLDGNEIDVRDVWIVDKQDQSMTNVNDLLLTLGESTNGDYYFFDYFQDKVIEHLQNKAPFGQRWEFDENF